MRHRVSYASAMLIHHREESRAATVTILVLASLVTCWSPLVTVSCLHVFGIELNSGFSWIKLLALLFVLSNTVTTPILYAYRWEVHLNFFWGWVSLVLPLQVLDSIFALPYPVLFSLLVSKVGLPRPLLPIVYFWSLQTLQFMWKNVQYPVPGFEPTTSCTWVSSRYS